MKAPVLIAALLVSTSALPSQAQDWSLHTGKMEKSVFRVEASLGDKGGWCSSVLINEKDHIVLTAAHCIPEKAEGRSITVDGKHAELLKWNAVLDLALLKVPELGGTALALRAEGVTGGTPVMVAGFGLAATRLKFGFGWVADHEDDSVKEVGKRFWAGMVGTVGGHSGGAVVDQTGKLISLVQAGLPTLFVGPTTETLKDFGKPHWSETK